MQHDHDVEQLLKLTEREMQRGEAELLDEIQERRRKQEQTGARKRPGRKGKRDERP